MALITGDSTTDQRVAVLNRYTVRVQERRMCGGGQERERGRARERERERERDGRRREGDRGREGEGEGGMWRSEGKKERKIALVCLAVVQVS